MVADQGSICLWSIIHVTINKINTNLNTFKHKYGFGHNEVSAKVKPYLLTVWLPSQITHRWRAAPRVREHNLADSQVGDHFMVT